MNNNWLIDIIIGAIIGVIFSILFTSILKKSAQLSPKNLSKSRVEKIKLEWLQNLSESFKNPSEISLKYSRANALSILLISISVFLFFISYFIKNEFTDTVSWVNLLINELNIMSAAILFASIFSNFSFIETMDKYKNKEKLNKAIRSLELKIERIEIDLS